MRIATRRTLQIIALVSSVVANAVTIAIPLLGLALGILHLPQGYGLLSKPGPVLTLMYVGMWLGWIWIGYSLLRVVKKRSGARPHQDSFETLMYVITVPVTFIWILTWGELLGWPASGPSSSSSDADMFVTLLFAGGAALLGGGGVASGVALSIDKFFNPGDYPEAQQIHESQG